MFDLQVPFFKPLWLRIGITAVCLIWALFEFMTGAVAWAMMFGAIGVYCFFEFFIVWNPVEEDEE